ncbi:MAG: phosphoglycerate dehydrogenase [Polyangia bacterium]|jgi:D-3-phosphoglycerate dehydrogenase
MHPQPVNGVLEKPPLKVLLLENIHQTAIETMTKEGLVVETVPKSLPKDQLIARLAGVQVLGIRSKTHLTAELLASAPSLQAVGCFCIGTNQVDLTAANRLGLPVWNAPFSNTRSVAEMIISEIISLARQLGDRSREVHVGKWRKVASSCFEVRGKTLGIIGYGHIGSQVSVLAEALGMRVVFYDIIPKLQLGNSQPCESLHELLRMSDFVTLHVPATPQTQWMIGPDELAAMKKGSYLLNASRGTVVQIDALCQALRSGHVAGAAIDVYPEEPEENTDSFVTELAGLPNVILTPHIGGSTQEAQASIGREVAQSICKFVAQGATTGSVNFPQVELPPSRGTHRILNVHKNVPGVLRDISRVVSELNANIHSQMLSTDENIGYLIMDLDQDVSAQVRDGISGLPTSIRTRIL